MIWPREDGAHVAAGICSTCCGAGEVPAKPLPELPVYAGQRIEHPDGTIGAAIQSLAVIQCGDGGRPCDGPSCSNSNGSEHRIPECGCHCQDLADVAK